MVLESAHSSSNTGDPALRATQDKAIDRLEGLIPVAEDWHARMGLVNKSAREKCTMYQLRNRINRTSVPPDPSTNMQSPHKRSHPNHRQMSLRKMIGFSSGRVSVSRITRTCALVLAVGVVSQSSLGHSVVVLN